MTVETRRILVCGHRAFAARGLSALLQREGHQVDLFSRGSAQPDPGAITGPVAEVHANAHLAPRYDTVVNFIVLKRESVASNLAYLASLLRMCRDRRVSHLIQISSMSVYRDSVRTFTEHAATKALSRSAGYATSKVAAEHYLRQHADGLELSFLRPACILGPGMPDPVGSVGVVLPTRELLVLGPGRRLRPVIARTVMHKAIARIVCDPPRADSETLLAVDRRSPPCLDYLQACCEIYQAGTRAISYPTPFWLGAFLQREWRHEGRPFSTSRLLRNLGQRCLLQRYDPSWTENRLGFSLTSDWRREMGAPTSPGSAREGSSGWSGRNARSAAPSRL